jgi:hypothetical protein
MPLTPPTTIPPSPPAYVARAMCPRYPLPYTTGTLGAAAPSSVFLRPIVHASQPFPQPGDIEVDNVANTGGELHLVIRMAFGTQELAPIAKRVLDPDRGSDTAFVPRMCRHHTTGRIIVTRN